MNTFELTLCPKCANIYYEMTDRVIKRKDYNQVIKEECNICRVKGYDYIIEMK